MSTVADPDGAIGDWSPPVAAVAGSTDAGTPLGRGRSRPAGQVALWISVAWLAALVLMALFADLLPLHDPNSRVRTVPATSRMGMRWPEPLGTDFVGRSMLSRLVYGARQSLTIGVMATAIAATVGTLLGLLSGYARGAVDTVTRVVIDTLLAFPPLVLLIALASIGSRDLKTVVIGLSVLGIPSFGRLARANTLPLTRSDHVLAARTLGASHSRIIFREVLPYVILPILSVIFLYMAVIIVAEGSLSFLGLGVPPPASSWGGMVNDGRALIATHPHLVVLPSVFLMATVLSLNVLGDQLRRRLDRGHSALR